MKAAVHNPHLYAQAYVSLAGGMPRFQRQSGHFNKDVIDENLGVCSVIVDDQSICRRIRDDELSVHILPDSGNDVHFNIVLALPMITIYSHKPGGEPIDQSFRIHVYGPAPAVEQPSEQHPAIGKSEANRLLNRRAALRRAYMTGFAMGADGRDSWAEEGTCFEAYRTGYRFGKMLREEAEKMASHVADSILARGEEL